jgi:hypothetical protein
MCCALWTICWLLCIQLPWHFYSCWSTLVIYAFHLMILSIRLLWFFDNVELLKLRCGSSHWANDYLKWSIVVPCEKTIVWSYQIYGSIIPFFFMDYNNWSIVFFFYILYYRSINKRRTEIHKFSLHRKGIKL